MGDCISWCNPVFKRVEALPDLDYATRNHAYIMPDNKAYILNESGDGFTELTSTATTGGTSYDDKPLVARVEKLEAKEDKDKQTLTLNGTTLSISNGNSVELPKGTTYKAGNGITITEDGTINNSVVDTNTKYRLIATSNNIGDKLKTLTQLGVKEFNSLLSTNAIQVTLPTPKYTFGDKELYIQFPKISTKMYKGQGSNEQTREFIMTYFTIPINQAEVLGIARVGRYTFPEAFGNIHVMYDLSTNGVLNLSFYFEFYKFDLDNNRIITEEPTLTVPASLDNLTTGLMFGANFQDEYTIEVTMEEPKVALAELVYSLKEVTE
jgi:hypothetical protein